jgi:hypothetical protein
MSVINSPSPEGVVVEQAPLHCLTDAMVEQTKRRYPGKGLHYGHATDLTVDLRRGVRGGCETDPARWDSVVATEQGGVARPDSEAKAATVLSEQSVYTQTIPS